MLRQGRRAARQPCLGRKLRPRVLVKIFRKPRLAGSSVLHRVCAHIKTPLTCLGGHQGIKSLHSLGAVVYAQKASHKRLYSIGRLMDSVEANFDQRLHEYNENSAKDFPA